jgi:hypothetical protein
MATTLERSSALKTLCDEELGFRFGDPLRVSEKSLAVVVPILRKTAAHRQYVTLPEAGSNVDIRDTGRIDRFEVKNHTEENLFIRFGTIFKGATQERSLLRSALVFPGAKVEVEVRCVHASRGIRPGTKTSYGGYTNLDYDQRIYAENFGTGKATQAHVWRTVDAVSASMFQGGGSSGTLNRDQRIRAESAPSWTSRIGRGYGWTPTATPPRGGAQAESEASPYGDDFASNLDAFTRNFEDVIRSVEMQEDQSGFALISSSGVETVETFDSPLSWKAIHEDAVKRIGAKLIDQPSLSVFEYKPEKAKEAIRAVLSKPFREKVIWEHKPNNGDPHVLITGLADDGYTGEVVEVDHRVIHLCIIKMA